MGRFRLGFTLVELMVVVGMMAMLMGLVIPQFVTFNRKNMLREEARVVEGGFKSAQSLAESGIQNPASTIDRYRFDLLQGSGDSEGCYRGYRTVAVDSDGNATGDPLELVDLTCPVVIQSNWSTLYFDRAGGQLVNPLGLANQTFTLCYPEAGSAVDMSFDATGKIVTGDVVSAVGKCTCSTSCGAMVETVIEEVVLPTATPTPVPSYTVTGYVDVQGRVNDSGVTVTFSPSSGPAPVIIMPQEQTPMGNKATFVVSRFDNSKWEDAYRTSFVTNFTTKKFQIDSYSGILRLRFNQKETPFAGIEHVQINACGKTIAPKSAIYVGSGINVLPDISRDDFNIADVHEKPIEATWEIPMNCREGLVLEVKANEYNSNDANHFRFPEYGVDYETYSFANNRSVVVDGWIDEVDGVQDASYSPYWVPGTGHPSDNVYFYFNDDRDYIYLSADIVNDNTSDYGLDWIEVTIYNTNDNKPQSYRVTDLDLTNGVCGFGYTSKVKYKHQTCEVRIPKTAIKGYNINFSIQYYGTMAAPAYSATTASSGRFMIELPAGYYNVSAEKTGYLSLLASNVYVGGNITWGAVSLRGGDVNDDGTISQADLDIISAQYSNTCSTPGFDARADVNGDCTVNIQDLSLTGGNFGLSEPVSWTP